MAIRAIALATFAVPALAVNAGKFPTQAAADAAVKAMKAMPKEACLQAAATYEKTMITGTQVTVDCGAVVTGVKKAGGEAETGSTNTVVATTAFAVTAAAYLL